MTKQDSLLTTISALIDRKAEGTYWDFKREHHKDKSDLIHDVLCLANAKHTGDRFLIFGVDDKDFSLYPINEDPRRTTQAELAGLFRDNANNFFQSRFPDFYLKEITVNQTLLDVLVIADTAYKPYYLVKKYKKVRAHHIYTRVCDTNTPVNDSAQPHEIERMWRERFGLDMTPYERAIRYLSKPDAWSLITENGCNMNFHHKIFPEFTLRVASAEDQIACHEEWTRGEICRDNNRAWYYELYYHQTRLAQVRCVNFDDNKKSMVAPDWEPRRAGRFYFYKVGSMEYAVQRFYSSLTRRDDSTKLSIGGHGEAADEARLRWNHQLKIPVILKRELDDFLSSSGEHKSAKPSTDETEQYQLFLRNQLEFEDWHNSP